MKKILAVQNHNITRIKTGYQQLVTNMNEAVNTHSLHNHIEKLYSGNGKRTNPNEEQTNNRRLCFTETPISNNHPYNDIDLRGCDFITELLKILNLEENLEFITVKNLRLLLSNFDLTIKFTTEFNTFIESLNTVDSTSEYVEINDILKETHSNFQKNLKKVSEDSFISTKILLKEQNTPETEENSQTIVLINNINLNDFKETFKI